MPRKYDVVAVTGEYTTKSGETKRKYQSCGMVIEKDGKFYLKMTSLVTVDDKGQVVNFFNLFEPRDALPAKVVREPLPPSSPDPDFDSEIPF